MKKIPFPLPSVSFSALTLMLVAAPSVNALVVYEENFDGLTSLPGSVSVGNNTDATTSLSTTEGNPAPSMHLLDSSTSAGTSGTINGNNWADFSTANPSENIFQVSFDWRITSSTSSGASTSRVNIRLGGTTPTTVSIGFGHTTVDAVNTNFFYAAGGTTGASPSSSNAIGYNGSSFADGFSFGTYDGANGANNNTGGYYRFTMSYEDQATEALLTVVNLDNPSQSETFTISGITATTVEDISGNFIQALTGFSGTGEAYVDNISIAVIPELSSSALLLGLVMIGMLACKRRR